MLVACDTPSEAGAPVLTSLEIADGGKFADAFSLGETITLRESDSTLVVGAGNFETFQDSLFALPDLAEANVKLFGMDGVLRRQFGRKGNGPGEFRTPGEVRIDRDGNFHTLDLGAKFISVHDKTGRYLRQVSLASLPDAHSFYRIPTNEYLVVGPIGSSDKVVHIVNEAGKVTRSYLGIANATPPGSDAAHVWRPLRHFDTALWGDTLYLALPYMNTLWKFNVVTNESQSVQLSIPGYQAPPSPPEDMHNDRVAFDQWIASFDAFHGIKVAKGRLIINVVRGQGHEAPHYMLTDYPDGIWRKYSDAATIAFGTGKGLFRVATDSTTTLSRFTTR